VKVPGTTGDVHSDFRAKFETAVRLFESDYQFGFVHIKAVDDLAHDREQGKRLEYIQRIDGYLGECLNKLRGKFLIVVTGDHTTTVHIGDHSFEPVPFTMCDLDVYRRNQAGESVSDAWLRDNVNKFNEVDCARGGLGRFPGSQVMPLVLKTLKKMDSR
jgi:2,3-bisphosphoglycerate-independent phosphoglycerate mutase